VFQQRVAPNGWAGLLTVAVGAAAVMTAVTLLLSAGSWLAVVLEVLLLAGLDMIFTGVTGHCSLYQRPGRAPNNSGGTR